MSDHLSLVQKTPPPQTISTTSSLLRLCSQPSSGCLRNHPPSPRTSSRHPSMSQQSMADLLSIPPPPRTDAGAPRDWRTVRVGELIRNQELHFVEGETTMEAACQMLIDHDLGSVLIRNGPLDDSICGTFDYSDLAAFLLLIMGIYQPEDEEDVSSFQDLAKKARAGSSIPVKLVKDLGKKDPFVTVSESQGLEKAVEIFGSGVHRLAITAEGSTQVIGVLSQLQLLTYLWENARAFPALEHQFPLTVRDLNIGSANVISVNADKRVIEAFELMNSEGISSLAVVDTGHNVVGNISTADVKYLTKASSIPLLRSSCLHFLTVILTERGTHDGQDSYPVFYVNPLSTLAHTIAKLVATRAHRMWLVESSSPASSAPPTPTTQHAFPNPFMSSPPLHAGSTFTAGSSPGARLSGRLIGVVSVTDIMNLFARSSGLTPVDPNEARRQRRRSSSSTTRTSIDIPRGSFELRRP